MQVTLPFTAFVLSLASSVLAGSHRVPLGSLNHRSLGKRAATFTPTAPGPGDKFNAGSPITIQWDADTSGSTKWKQTTIRLMSGSNLNMSQLEVVGVIDGTDTTKTELQWPAPAVNPYSAIYFFQFDHGGDAQKDPTWTTRFAIADASGNTVAPPFDHQPENKDNPPIPYGNGVLAAASGSGSGSASGANATTGTATLDDGSATSTTTSASASNTLASTISTSVSTTASRPNTTASTAASPSSTGAAAPQFIARPVGMALTGAAVGVAAIFLL
ncbi:hypothetical protein OC844_000356 [Tilletia horrida]|nr:hypothetical protein OC844_000356 [Tilletia horrida]